MDKNELKLEVKLTFDEPISPRHRDEIVENVLNSLLHTAHTAGIVPDDCETFTSTITVSNPESGAFLGRDLMTGELI